MPDNTELQSYIHVKVDGAPPPEELLSALLEVSIENSLHLPDVATLIFHDANGSVVDDSHLEPGKKLTINAKLGDDEHKVFDGDIVELESDFTPGDRRVVVRAFDRLHKLARGRHVRSFVQMTDSDIVAKIAADLGLSPDVESTNTVHDVVIQDNTTDLEFLRERAAMQGYLVWVNDNTLYFKKPTDQEAAVTLKYNEDLAEFHPRMTTVDQIKSASAGGWDPEEKRAVVGSAHSPTNGTSPGTPFSYAKAKDAFSGPAALLVADRPIRNQSIADHLAQATLDRRAGRCVEAEGVTRGNPKMRAGMKVKLQDLGSRFSGEYFVTGTSHVQNGHSGYITRFTVSGFQPTSLLALMGPERDGLLAQRVGLVIGLVTDNNDEKGQGRVKVKYPWLSEKDASDWARVVVPGGGSQRGMAFLPEVNDEVLVGFEHGDLNYPYVLGGLWNGKDKPPGEKDKVISGGKVNQRIIRTRTGHIITLDDSDDAPGIEIVDNTKKNKITLDSKKNKLTIHVEGDMLFEATSGDITFKSQTFNVEASGKLKVKGQSVEEEAQMDYSIKAGTDLKLQGTNSSMKADANLSLSANAQAELKGNAKASLSSAGEAEVSGALVKVG